MTPQIASMSKPLLADDILHGADEIAEFLFGSAEYRRKVYYLAECTRLPLFRLGSTLCARKSVLLNWIADQERKMVLMECGSPHNSH
jgi:hypothetical protein